MSRQMWSCWTFRQMCDQSPSCITSTNVGTRKLGKPDRNSADYFWEHIDICAFFFTIQVKENLQYRFLITFNFCKLLIKLSILASKIPQTFSGASSGACLGQLGHVWGIIWGMAGASSGVCLDDCWGILSSMDNNPRCYIHL